MRQQGFTLLEVMVALAILAITLVIIFSQQAISINMGNEARIITKATLVGPGADGRPDHPGAVAHRRGRGEGAGSDSPHEVEADGGRKLD